MFQNISGAYRFLANIDYLCGFKNENQTIEIMKHYFLNIGILSILLGGIVDKISYQFKYETDLKQYKTGDGMSVWDFSDNCMISPEAASIIVYGDTLYSETLLGIRRWYVTRGDSVYFEREENLTEALIPYNVIPTAALGDNRFADELPYRTKGANSACVSLSRDGFYQSFPTISGHMVIERTDTIRVNMARERFTYKEQIKSDSIKEEGLSIGKGLKNGINIMEIRRWFADEKIPLAIAYDYSFTGEDDEKGYSESGVFFRKPTQDKLHEYDNGELSQEDLREVVSKVLNEIVINVSGGMITLIGYTPIELDLTLDILTDSGISCMHKEFTVKDGVTMTFSCEEVPLGRQLTVLAGYGCREGRYIRFK